MFFQVCLYFILIKTFFVFQFSAHISSLKHSNNLSYFSTCLPKALGCFGISFIVFRLFEICFGAPCNEYFSSHTKSAHKTRSLTFVPQAAPDVRTPTTGRPDGRQLASSLGYFQLTPCSIISLFKGVFSQASSTNKQAKKTSRNSANLFSY